MPNLVSASRYDSGGNVTLLGTGTNRCLIIIPASRNGGAIGDATVTVGGVPATRHATINNAATGTNGQSGVFYILDASMPAAGANEVVNTWAAALDNVGILLEYDDIDQTDPLSAVASAAADAQLNPFNLTATLMGQAGKLALIYGALADGSYSNTSGFINSNDGHALVADTLLSGTKNTRLAVYSDAVVAGASEIYSLAFSQRGDTAITTASAIVAAFAINAPAANVDPVLDTPQADISIAANEDVAIDIGANFSDANSDTLAITVDPALPSGLTLTDGVITRTGPLSITAAADYTFSADDGLGGTPATDVVSIEITAAVILVNSTTTIEAGEAFTITINDGIDLTTATVISASLGGIELTGQANITTSTIDFDSFIGGLEIGAYHELVLVVDDVTVEGYSALLGPPPNMQVVTLMSVSADSWLSGAAYSDNGGAEYEIGASDQIVIDEVSTPGGYAVVLATDGTITLTGASAETVSQTVDWFYLDAQDGYAASDTQTLTLLSPTIDTTAPTLTLIGGAITHIQGFPFTDPGATFNDDLDVPRTVYASNAPNVNVPGLYTLLYDATDDAGNAATQVTRTVTVVAADSYPDAITFQNVANAALNTVYSNIQFITGVDTGQNLVQVGGFELSNDGTSWSSTVVMIPGQSRIRATIDTTGAANSETLTLSGSLNGRAISFAVTTIAAVTLTFSIGSSDPLTDQSGALINYTVPIVEAWTGAPEEAAANGYVVADTWLNVVIADGQLSISGSGVAALTDYLIILRDTGNSLSHYHRIVGQFA